MDNSYGLAELHEHLLIIMDDIDRVCRKHGIEYTLTGGSLLGAVREHGFIPWDDDMDIRMLRSEFEKFKEVYEKEKDDRFVIGHPCNLATYSVIDPDYVIPGMDHKEGTCPNPWISVFPMDDVPQNEFLAKMKAHKMRLLSGMMGKPAQYANFSDRSKKLWDAASFLGKIIGPKTAEKIFEFSCVSLNGKGTGLCSCYTVNTKGIYKRYPRGIYEGYTDMKFEDRVYRGISRYDEYLSTAYGKDYMTPISKEQRKPRHF